MNQESNLKKESSTATSPRPGGAPAIELVELQPDSEQLDFINRIVAAAIGSWDLPERVKRMSIPLYRYNEIDLPHMRFVAARSGESDEIIGVAAVEEADPAEGPARGAMLLHGIYVDSRYHRQGVGGMLLAAAEKVAASTGASARAAHP